MFQNCCSYYCYLDSSWFVVCSLWLSLICLFTLLVTLLPPSSFLLHPYCINETDMTTVDSNATAVTIKAGLFCSPIREGKGGDAPWTILFSPLWNTHQLYRQWRLMKKKNNNNIVPPTAVATYKWTKVIIDWMLGRDNDVCVGDWKDVGRVERYSTFQRHPAFIGYFKN